MEIPLVSGVNALFQTCLFGYSYSRTKEKLHSSEAELKHRSFVDSITIATSALNCYTVVRTCHLVSCYAVATRVIATEADFAHFAFE